MRWRSLVSTLLGALVLMVGTSAAQGTDTIDRLDSALPFGADLPIIEPYPIPDPDAFPRADDKVTMAMIFRREAELAFDLKVFPTAPQDPARLWETVSLGEHDLGRQPLPIAGDLDMGKGEMTWPVALDPGAFVMMTVVVDNRQGEQDKRFYVPGPHPETEFFLAEDTDPAILLHVTPVCLCQSVVYSAPAGGLWYRVIGVYVSPDAPTPSRAVFGMTVLRAPRAAGQ